jgi:UDP-galactopyranose mutase
VAHDLLVVGAGPVGCAIAERAATQQGWRSLVVEKRPHVAGHCYDAPHDGILVHRYGPHYFRTNDTAILDYLSRFTEWIDGEYVARSLVRGQLVPFPINLRTLEHFFKVALTPGTARDLLERVRDRTIEAPRNSEEVVLSRVGRELYEALYLGYTQKQWERHPRDLDPSVCGRVPVRFDDDERYSEARHQVMPRWGYTRMFERMLDHPLIEVRLNTDYFAARDAITPARATVYTGPIDQYFDYRLGRLPWRSLAFEFKTFDEAYRQPCVQINYPNDFDYTRSVEYKHLTRPAVDHTVVAYEYPRASGEPYYPVPTAESRALYARYQALAEHERIARRVHFVGRLARFAYINMDEAVGMALDTFEELRRP